MDFISAILFSITSHHYNLTNDDYQSREYQEISIGHKGSLYGDFFTIQDDLYIIHDTNYKSIDDNYVNYDIRQLNFKTYLDSFEFFYGINPYNLGNGLMSSPMNYINPSVNFFDDETNSSLYSRFTWYGEAQSLNLLYFQHIVPGVNETDTYRYHLQTPNSDDYFALHHNLFLGTLDFNTAVFAHKDNSVESFSSGLSLPMRIGTFKAEASWSRDIIGVAYFSESSSSLGPMYTQIKSSDDSFVPKYLVSSQILLPADYTVDIEYYYNSIGLDKDEVSSYHDFDDFLTSLGRDFPVQRETAREIPENYFFFNSAKNFLLIRFMKLDLLDNFDAAISTTAAYESRMTSSILELDYDYNDYLSFSLDSRILNGSSEGLYSFANEKMSLKLGVELEL